MYQSLLFELVKLRRARFITICIFLLVMVIVSYFTYVDRKTISIEEAIISVKDANNSFSEQVEQIEKEIAVAKRDFGKVDINLREVADNVNIQADAHQLIYAGIQEQNWSIYWQGELLNATKTISEKEEELETIITSYSWPTPFTVFANVDQMKWMEERNIQPVFKTNQVSWKTLYDLDYSDSFIQQAVEESSEKFSSSGIFFSYLVLEHGFSMVGVFFLLLIFADIITKEGFSKNGPIQLLRIQPIHRRTFWITKCLTVLLSTIAVTGLVIVISLTLGTLFERFGDWNYPVLIYGPERTYEILSMAEFIVTSFSLFFIMVSFAFSLLFLFSIITERALLSLGVVILIFIVCQIITQQTLFFSWSHWLPFHYVDAYSIVSGRYAVIQDNTNLTYLQGIVTTGIWTLGTIVLTIATGKWKSGVQR